MLEIHLGSEFRAGTAAERGPASEVPLGEFELPFRRFYGFRQRALLVLEESAAQSFVRRRVGTFDLRPRVVPRSRRQRLLVDRELFDRRLFERAAEAGERIAVVEVVEVALVLARRAGDVEAGFGARSGEGDVAPFLEARFAGAEDEGALDGQALGGVAGDRVGVASVARLEVAAAEFDGRAAVGVNGERPSFEVDVSDGAAGCRS